MRAPLVFALFAGLAACGGGSNNGNGGGGGGGGSTTPAPKPAPVVSASAFDTYNSFETAHDAFRAEKTSQFHTAFSGGEFPTTGTATFSGTYRSVLDASGSPTTIYGLADLTADFAGSSLSGDVDTFVGERSTGARGFYAGTVTLLNGVIGKDPAVAGSRPNDLRFDYAGTLTGNGQTIVLNGSNDMGKFLRTPITGLEATGTSTATVNGITVTDNMELYADRN